MQLLSKYCFCFHSDGLSNNNQVCSRFFLLAGINTVEGEQGHMQIRFSAGHVLSLLVARLCRDVKRVKMPRGKHPIALVETLRGGCPALMPASLHAHLEKTLTIFSTLELYLTI